MPVLALRRLGLLCRDRADSALAEIFSLNAQRMIEARPNDRCRLLFVGIGWERKGGDVAVEVARLLNDRGLPTELTMLGQSQGTWPADMHEAYRVAAYHVFAAMSNASMAMK